jgi:hypothetical protein
MKYENGNLSLFIPSGHLFPLHPSAVNKLVYDLLKTATKIWHPRGETRWEFAASSRQPYRRSAPVENAIV